jgi:hypothetical protein
MQDTTAESIKKITNDQVQSAFSDPKSIARIGTLDFDSSFNELIAEEKETAFVQEQGLVDPAVQVHSEQSVGVQMPNLETEEVLKKADQDH